LLLLVLPPVKPVTGRNDLLAFPHRFSDTNSGKTYLFIGNLWSILADNSACRYGLHVGIFRHEFHTELKTGGEVSILRTFDVRGSVHQRRKRFVLDNGPLSEPPTLPVKSGLIKSGFLCVF